MSFAMNQYRTFKMLLVPVVTVLDSMYGPIMTGCRENVSKVKQLSGRAFPCPWRIPKSRGNWGLKKSVAV